MRKGFTLIELLAVIVILAIIAVIAVPIVLNIIDESKENATLRSADFYLDAAEYTISDAYLNHGGLQDGEYPITPEGNLCKTALPCSEENTLKVEVNGEVPKSGTITITNGNITELELKFEEKTIVKNSDGDLVYSEDSEDEKICTINRNDPTKYSVGDEVICELTDSIDKFYIIEEQPLSATSIQMLTEKNISIITNKQSDAIEALTFSNNPYWLDLEGNLLSKYGSTYPVYAYDENSNLYKYINAYEVYLIENGLSDVRATLMDDKKIENLGCEFYGSCDEQLSWVYSTSYWLGSVTDSGGGVMLVGSSGNFLDDYCGSLSSINNSGSGIRPLITIPTKYIK